MENKRRFSGQIFDTGRPEEYAGGYAIFVIDKFSHNDVQIGPMVNIESFSEDMVPEGSFDGQDSKMLTPDQARAFAAMLLRAAEEADKLEIIRCRVARDEPEDDPDGDPEEEEEEEEERDQGDV